MRRLYRVQRRSWQPALLVDTDLYLVLVALLIMATVRAWDYGAPIEKRGRSLSLVENAAPLWVWSAAFGVGALVLFVGVLSRRHLVVWVGHTWLGIAYAALALGTILPALARPWADGLRGGVILCLPALFHWLISRRMGPAPLHPDTRTRIRRGGPPRD